MAITPSCICYSMANRQDLSPGEITYLRNLIISDLQRGTIAQGQNRERANRLLDRLGGWL